MSPNEQRPVCSKCQTPMARYNVPHTGDKEQAWRLACSCKHSVVSEVVPSKTTSKPADQFRKATRQIELLRCRLCGSRAELWQRWLRDDIWQSFGACTNLEDVDGEACSFHLPDSEHFYCERKVEAARYWNLIMGPRGAVETQPVGSRDDVPLKALQKLLDAVDAVVAFDWSDNDEDAHDAICDLRKAARDYGTVVRIADETTDVTRMRNTLVQSGYTDCGGELWKPPLGRRPVFLDENLRLLDLVARILPYVQQSDPADFADIEAATAIGREATEALATIRPEEPKRNQANSTSSGLLAATPTPRGNLPNSLGTGGAGSHPAASSSEKASPAQLVDALQDPVHVEIGSTRPIQAVREGYCEHGIPRQFCTAVHDVCKDCGVELVSGTCDKCGAVNGDA